MSQSAIISLMIAYASFIILLIYVGYKSDILRRHNRLRPYIYSLSLGVYVSSWSFLGAIRVFSETGWNLVAMYIGPIVIFIFGYRFLKKIISITKQLHITSISDFIGTRYGKRQSVATLVAVLVTIPLLPYLGAQIKVIAMTVDLILAPSKAYETSVSMSTEADQIALLTVFFCMISALFFGTRNVDVSRQHRSLVLAIAIESLVKIVVFMIMAFYAVSLWSGGGAPEIQSISHINETIKESYSGDLFWAYLTISMLVIFCLPRQFHVGVLELENLRDLSYARWLFPIFLTIIAVSSLVFAITSASFDSATEIWSDYSIVALPLMLGHELMACIAFLGIFAASFGMVVILALTHTTMVCNDIIIPFLIKFRKLKLDNAENIENLVLPLRRTIIIVCMLCGYGLYHLEDTAFSEILRLASFASVIQLAPAFIGGLYWRKGHKNGVISGLIGGYSVWFITMVLPGLSDVSLYPVFSQSAMDGLNGWSTLKIFGLSDLSSAILLSLGVNTLLYIAFSLAAQQSLRDQVQAAIYIGDNHISPFMYNQDSKYSDFNPNDLVLLLEKFLGAQFNKSKFEEFRNQENLTSVDIQRKNSQIIHYAESELAKVLGTVVAHDLLRSLVEHRDLKIADVVSLLDKRKEEHKFNRQILQNTLAYMSQGVCVLDQDLKVLVWNRRFTNMLCLPDDTIDIGVNIRSIFEKIASLNIGRGLKEVISVNERIKSLRKADPNSFDFELPISTVLKTNINIMPSGDYVISLTDITDLKAIESELKHTNEHLEERVLQRTYALSVLNAEVLQAQKKAEEATRSKTRFLAAASHDLLQPLNAARLFASTLEESIKSGSKESSSIINSINHSLDSAENLLNALLDISKLDAGVLKPEHKVFMISSLIAELYKEFSILAIKNGLELRYVTTDLWIESDRNFLRSVLQNFLSNAVRYTVQGKILIGCRRKGENIHIEVWDTGIGISPDKFQKIFQEFYRIETQHSSDSTGLGLGLAITERLAKLLGHALQIKSESGKGSMFSVSVPLSKVPSTVRNLYYKVGQDLCGLRVLCVENDAPEVTILRQLLERWQCRIFKIQNSKNAIEDFKTRRDIIDVIIVTYNLTNEAVNLSFIQNLRRQAGWDIPVIIITNNQSMQLKEIASKIGGCQVLHTPLSPAALRALLSYVRKPIM